MKQGLRLITSRNKTQAVLLYQFGKVGSSALEKVIPGSVHMHDLMSTKASDMISPVRYRLLGDRPIYWCVKKWMYQLVPLLYQRVKIISLVREPIGRNVSMFFQSLPFWLADRFVTEGEELRSESKSLLEDVFSRDFNHRYALDWFDKELFRYTGVDIYSQPFDTEKGYQIFSKKNIDILVIRQDRLMEMEPVVEEFLGAEVRFEYENRAENKWYGPLKKEFEKGFFPNKDYALEMLNSKYSRHFFSPSEIQSLEQKYGVGS